MKENFAVINFFGDKFQAAAVRADFINKKIEISGSFEFAPENAFSILKNFFSFVFYPRAYSAIFIFSPKDAAGFGDAVSIDRLESRKKISEEELADLVSGAVWKFFDSGRSKALKQLNSTEPEIMLSDVSVYDFKVDGRKVVNPFKQAGKKISLEIGEVFANRAYLKKIIKLLPGRSKKAFIFDGGVCASRLLRRIAGKSKFIFAKTSKLKTDIFYSDGEKSGFHDYFSWGEESLYREISEILKIGNLESKAITEKMLAGETSDNFRKSFEKIFLNEIASLVQGLRAGALAADAKQIYLDFPFAEKAMKKGLKFKKISTNMIVPVNFSDILENFGFELAVPAGEAKEADFLFAAAILETYFSPVSSYPLSVINRLAKRRMMWLMPNQ
jgi:hypothetical protein